MTKTVTEELPPPAAERFFKIRSKVTGLFKIAGTTRWSKDGKTFTKKTLAGHLSLFKNENRPTGRDRSLPRPDLEQGAVYYSIPEEYEIVEYFALGELVPLERVMRAVLAKGAVISRKKS